jgi:hypothetical protein
MAFCMVFKEGLKFKLNFCVGKCDRKTKNTLFRDIFTFVKSRFFLFFLEKWFSKIQDGVRFDISLKKITEQKNSLQIGQFFSIGF